VKGIGSLGDLRVDGTVLLRFILKKQGVRCGRDSNGPGQCECCDGGERNATFCTSGWRLQIA
jgi:hypothetical protein